MTRRITPAFGLLVLIWVLALVQTGVRAQQGLALLPPGLVTTTRLETLIAETEGQTALEAEIKDQLVALYRKALSNLQEVADNRARAETFAQAVGSAPEQTQRIRERIAAAKTAAPAEPLSAGLDTSLDQLEALFKREQAERDAAQARRAGIERQLAYQENRPAAIRQRLAAAQEEQETLATALQAELAGDTGSALVQARRWGLETRYVALSTDIDALDQELLSLPMRLDLLAATRSEEAANQASIDQRVEALRALVKARREAEAAQARGDAERMLQATAGLEPALVRRAEENAALIQALAVVIEQNEHVEAELRQAERLAARTTANFERAKTAQAVGVPASGLGELLLQHRAALPAFALYARAASARKREMAVVSLSRLRHLEEAERLADAMATSTPAEAAAADALGFDLLEQRRDLLERQLEAEGLYLDRLRKLADAEARMLAAARDYDNFVEKQLFWLPTSTTTRLGDLAKLPSELRVLLAPQTWSEPAGILADRVAASPLFWLALLLCAVLLGKRRALIVAIGATATPLRSPSTDRFGYTLKALLLTLALAAPLPLLLGVGGWMLLGATHGTPLSLALGAYLVRIAVILSVLLVLRALCLPGGVAMAHLRWSESESGRACCRPWAFSTR